MVLVGLVCGGAGYGIGWFQGWLATSEAEEALDAALPRLHQLEARRQLSLAIEAVVGGDYSAARGKIDAARRELTSSPDAGSDEISGLIGHLGAVEIGAGDPEGEAQRIRLLASRLDGLQSAAAGP